MSKYDAQRALNIYKTFTKQTNSVVEYLGIALQYENATRLEIPKLKHAPTSLTSSLEEYLNDSDFEVNRRQYLAHQDVKKGKKPSPASKGESSDTAKKIVSTSEVKNSQHAEVKAGLGAGPPPGAVKSPAPDLIDFFESIEQNQQPMAVQSQQTPSFQPTQQPIVPPQQSYYNQNGQQAPSLQMNGGFGNTNPFGQIPQQQGLQQNPTGPAFVNYNQQAFSLPQQDAFSNYSQATGSTYPSHQQPFSTGQTSFASSQQPFSTGPLQPQPTNPFRQSMFPQATGGSLPNFQTSPQVPATLSPQSTNPFARSATMPINDQPTSSPFTSPPPPMPSQPSTQQLTPQRTGTNPFAKAISPVAQSPFQTQPLVANPTGSTNPFQQSMFVNQPTGQGLPPGQGSMGGLEQMPTVPVFPRSGQQPQQNPWS